MNPPNNSCLPYPACKYLKHELVYSFIVCQLDTILVKQEEIAFVGDYFQQRIDPEMDIGQYYYL